MPRFTVRDLPNETRQLHESQSRWRKKNWEKTLAEHKDEIDVMIAKLNLFDIWSNALQDNNTAKTMIPEIFMDAYISIHFASFGLYKYANTCLRSELETALRLIFFSTHEVEFHWWLKGDEWYREDRNYPDVWGKGYTYFERLKEIKEFENKCESHRRLFSNKALVKQVYGKLSKYIHSGAGHFQTKPNMVSPQYDISELRRWVSTYQKIQNYIHILLALVFSQKFKGLEESDRKRILDLGMDSYYKNKVKETLGLAV